MTSPEVYASCGSFIREVAASGFGSRLAAVGTPLNIQLSQPAAMIALIPDPASGTCRVDFGSYAHGAGNLFSSVAAFHDWLQGALALRRALSSGLMQVDDLARAYLPLITSLEFAAFPRYGDGTYGI